MKPIERVSQTDMVAQELIAYFRTDAVKEGDKLPTEMELCDLLKVGRSTVREAIKALQVMGYVKMVPGKGAFLQRKTLESPVSSILSWLGSRKLELADFIEVRMQLEPLAARLAVERGVDAELAALDAVRLEYEGVLGSEPFSEALGERLGVLDARFHAAIGEASHNDLLVQLNNIVIEAFQEFRSRTFKVETHAHNAVKPHRAICAALLKRDAGAAQAAMRRHLFMALEDMSLGGGR